MNSNYKKILAEVLKAYADCGDMPFEQACKIRNLSFRASAPVTRDEAAQIFAVAVAGGYNEFQSDLIKFLPVDSQVTIAREGSVCVYVKGLHDEILANSMKSDEWHHEEGETRIWWD